MTQRARLVATVVIAVVLVAATAIYIARSRSAKVEQAASAPVQDTTAVSQIEHAPRIVFRNTALGPDYGKVAMVTLADPTGPRGITSLDCDRVFSTGSRTLCLASDRGVVTTYSAKVYPRARRHPDRYSAHRQSQPSAPVR